MSTNWGIKFKIVYIFYLVLIVEASWLNENVNDSLLFEDDIEGIPYYVYDSITDDDLAEDVAVKHSYALWPNATVPFVISNLYFSKMDVKYIEAIMVEFKLLSCVKFVHRQTEPNYIEIKFHSLTCSSYVGNQNRGAQTVQLNHHCMDRNDILHEMMHVLGFFHEHNRPDRDNHVVVNWENIHERSKKNFKKQSMFNVTYLDTPYDVSSVMHYPSKGSSKNGKPTIVPLQKGVDLKADGLSKFDIVRLNRLYNCSNKDSLERDVAKTSPVTTSPQGRRKLLEPMCPRGWTYHKAYPNICYQYVSRLHTWSHAEKLCEKVHNGATLPTFKDSYEYLSYSEWWKSQPSIKKPSCTDEVWLGLTFDIKLRNYTWTDGSKLTFTKFWIQDQLEQRARTANLRFILAASGSSWHEVSKHYKADVICQLRIGTKCPGVENWYYDSEADICYYFNQTMNLATWNTARDWCETKNASLPYFLNQLEYLSYKNLLQKLQLFCNADMWLGYKHHVNSNSYVSLKESATSFHDWKVEPDINQKGYIFLDGWSDNMGFEIDNDNYSMRWYMCQWRPPNLK